jgi:hypothetical protein
VQLSESLFAILSKRIPSFSGDRLGLVKSILIDAESASNTSVTMDAEYVHIDKHVTRVQFRLEGCSSLKLPPIIGGVIELGDIFDEPVVGWESAAYGLRSESVGFSCYYRCATLLR